MTERSHLVEVTAQEVRERAFSSLFFTGFATFCACFGLDSMDWASMPVLAGIGAVSVGLLAMVALLFRRGRELPVAAEGGDRERRAQLMFRAVNIIQWVSIGTALAILTLLHMPEYAVPAVATIVGLHLFPLADTFRFKQHYVTGALLIVWSMGSLALLARDRVAGVASLGVGVILLVSAAWTLMSSLSAGAAVGSAGARA